MKYILLIARNIINLEQVDAFIENIVKDMNYGGYNNINNIEIQQWVKKQLREYLIKDYNKATVVDEKILNDKVLFRREFKKEPTEWDIKDIKKGNSYYINFHGSEISPLLNEIFSIILYFGSLDSKELNKIYKIPFNIALNKANQWNIENKKKFSSLADEKGEHLERTYSNLKWVRLITPEALHREGDIQKICLEDGRYDNKVAKQESFIYSLRNKKDKPYVTIEVLRNGTIEQIKGFKDGKIGIKYNPFVLDFIQNPVDAFPNGFKRINDLNNTTIIEIGKNEYIDVTSIPENFTINNSLELRRLTCKLPNNLTINGSLFLKYYKYNELPKGLIINGDLFLDGSWITELPNDLKVSGRLSLSQSKVKILPKEMVFKDDLDLSFTDIDILPEGLIVEGSLFLDSTKVTEIPPNVTVGGNLILVKFYPSKIVSIGNNLTVGKDLDMTSSKIKELPSNVKIGGNLHANFSKLLTLPSDIKIGGDIFLEKSSITFLPDNLTVNKNLYITRSKLKKLPKNLTVNGNLDISFTKITKIPKGLNLTVKKNFSVYGLTDGKDLETSIKIPDDIIYRRLLP